MLPKKKRISVNETEKTNHKEISSFDLNVKIIQPDSNFIALWTAKMKEIGLNVEFHPDFDINNQSGFLLFKIQVIDSSFTNKYGQGEWLSGFELYISKFDSEEYFSFFEQSEIDAMPKNIKEIYDKAELDFYFSVNPQKNTSEFRMAWYAASTLTKLYDGILEEAYSGEDYISIETIEVAINKTKHFETSLTDKNWKLKEFESWK